MLTVCYGAKGGQGCSTVAALLAMTRNEVGRVLVDTGGDLPAVLGIPDKDEPGLYDVLRSDAPVTSLVNHVSFHGRLGFVTAGGGEAGDVPEARWRELADALVANPGHWIVDAGTGPARAMLDVADHAMVVTRYCYLALRAAHRLGLRATGAVTIREEGRALTQVEVERIVGAPVVADIPWTPDVARSVDAGLLGGWRIAREVQQPLDKLVAWTRQVPAEPAC
jgi:hypothetical protein